MRDFYKGLPYCYKHIYFCYRSKNYYEMIRKIFGCYYYHEKLYIYTGLVILHLISRQYEECHGNHKNKKELEEII